MRLTSPKLARARGRLLQGRVRQCPEISEGARRSGRIHHALGEEDTDHPFRGVGVCGSAEAAVPTETARSMKDFLTPDVDRHAQTPATRAPKEHLGARPLCG